MDYPPILDSKVKVKAPLRCDGVGGLLLGELNDGRRVSVRWFAPGTGGPDALAALGKLPKHPALPQVLLSGQEASCDWVAIEYPDGELLDVNKLSAEQLSLVVSRLASALAVLHGLQLVHGELADDSIMLKPDGSPLLFDVPVALANRATDRRGERTELASLTRTAAFLSPERARGGGKTAEADVYALGAVICAASFDVPVLERLHLTLSGQVSFQAPPDFTPAQRELVLKMVAAEPKDRPSAGEIASAFATPVDPFEALLQQGPVTANGMHPMHEPTIQDGSVPTHEELPAVIVAPDALPVRKSGPKPALNAAPVRKSGAKPVLIDARPTAPTAAKRAAIGEAPPMPAMPSRLPISRSLSWFAATNGRLGALVAGAVLCFLITLMTFGEHQSRRSELDAAMRRPNAAQQARERAQRLQDAPARPASAEELRKATQKEDNDAY